MINLTIEKETLQSMGSDFLNSIPEVRNSGNIDVYLEQLLVFIDEVLLKVTAMDSADVTYTSNFRTSVNATNARNITVPNVIVPSTLRSLPNDIQKENLPQRFPFHNKIIK